MCKIISSVNSRPAVLAVMKGTMQPATNARNATLTIVGRLSGAKALKAPIIMPIALGFPKPQIA